MNAVGKTMAIVGGSGFIGTHLTRELLDRGFAVRVVDVREPRLNVPFAHADVLDRRALSAALRGVDGVYHLASLMGVENCLAQAGTVARVNLEGAANVSRACLDNGVPRLLFTSSSEVYCDGSKVPFAEADEKHPKSPYGRTKLAAEGLLRDRAGANLAVRIVRFFNAYGPQQSEQFVVRRFLRQARNGEELTVYGDGEQIRCFTHVRDVVRGTAAAFEHGSSVEETFNIACPTPTRLIDLAHLVLELFDRRNGIRFLPLGGEGVRSAEIEIRRRIPDVDRARRLLGFEARVALREGLEEMARDGC
jgi:nucleoside-diphosphate-sugar epimerase